MASEQQTPITPNSSSTKKSGVIGIIGRPSAGKSSLVNRICGAKVSIVSPYPQTTRTRIRGIYSEDRGQLLFLDTPGYHLSDKKLNQEYQEVVTAALPDCDALLYVRDVTRYSGTEEEAILDIVRKSGLPWIAALNKIDAVNDAGDSAKPPRVSGRKPKMDSPEVHAAKVAAAKAAAEAAAAAPTPPPAELGWEDPAEHPPAAVVAVSAETGAGMKDLLAALFDVSAAGEPMYPEEYYTDQDPQFRIAEIIREQAIRRTEQEVPHAIYVDIADAEYDAQAEKLNVRAFLVVERESQKGIVVGKGGEKIKAIRLASLRQLNQLFSYRIKLDLRVKVQPKWRQREATIRRITRSGFGD
ncbi:MAG: GTPase Era [Spirochaeta sp.]